MEAYMAHNTVKVERVKELGGRDATLLDQGSIRVMIDDQGGMIPELTNYEGGNPVNAHWLPWFRSNSGRPFGAGDEQFWKVNLLYHLAGNFPCAPNFGGDSDCDGMQLPPHGWTANLLWQFTGKGSDDKSAWAVSTLESPEPKMPLSFKKIDAVAAGQPVHYTSLKITNKGTKDMEICAAWHNNVGAPFLQAGCIISGAADRWSVSPAGGEFDQTTRLALDAEFASLEAAPLRSGGTENISIVPGPIGYTDMVCGAIPASAPLGWSALVNPFLKMAYVCFFTGPAAAGDDDIILRFNDLWMQYGGRRFTPWAAFEGGTDLAYCLGTENSAAGFAYGLQYAREKKEFLGAPTTVAIPAGKSRTLRYATLFAPYQGGAADSGFARQDRGIRSIHAEGDSLVLCAESGREKISADPEFKLLKKLEAL
jgi:hypothetical protein